MKKHVLLFSSLLLLSGAAWAQDTFSICAVDTVTGEVGSAGASCINNSVIISDVHPGKGVVHTQSFYLQSNQNYARTLMDQGLSPRQILDSLKANDAQGDSTVRQYGIVDLFNGKPRSIAFTGANCMNYKNHIIGRHYAIQGNILLNQGILDSMEARFLRTPGDLACKLMAAMQGAKVIGADTRCAGSFNSSKSSFLKVAKPADTQGNFHIDLNVPSGPFGFEPIDSLQTLFNKVQNCGNVMGIASADTELLQVSVSPNPVKGIARVMVTYSGAGNVHFELFSAVGQRVRSQLLNSRDELLLDARELNAGIYLYRISTSGGLLRTGRVSVLD
jgi:uncharacterized Ntn-hydrolase superfamily protein